MKYWIIGDEFLEEETKRSADAQGYLRELVCCKDCVHGSGDMFKTGIVCVKILSATHCDVIDAVVLRDHYCGWGRRKE